MNPLYEAFVQPSAWGKQLHVSRRMEKRSGETLEVNSWSHPKKRKGTEGEKRCLNRVRRPCLFSWRGLKCHTCVCVCARVWISTLATTFVCFCFVLWEPFYFSPWPSCLSSVLCSSYLSGGRTHFPLGLTHNQFRPRSRMSHIRSVSVQPLLSLSFCKSI